MRGIATSLAVVAMACASPAPPPDGSSIASAPPPPAKGEPVEASVTEPEELADAAPELAEAAVGEAPPTDDGGVDTLMETLPPGSDPEHGRMTPRFIGNVEIGKFKASDPDKKIVILARSVLRSCYEKELNEQPEATGKMLLTLDIDGTGAVSHVKTAAKGKLSASMELCIQRRGLKLKFAESDAGTRSFGIPLTFTRKKFP